MLNFLDICILMLFIMAFIVGFKRGVIKELISFVGIIIIFILSYIFKGYLGNLLCIIFPFFNFNGVINGISSINILMYQLIAFILIFALLLTVYELVLKLSKVLDKIVKMTIVLIIPSKILGGLVSIIKTYIIVFALCLLLMIPLGNNSLFNESTIVDYMIYKTPILTNYTKDIVAPIDKIYELGRKLSKNKISSNDANLEAIDIMLKYDIVDKSTIETLIKLNKLDNIKNIKSVLKKY